MKKKAYMKPTMRVVKMQHQGIICTSGGVKSVQSSPSHGDRHLGMGACFHGNFFAIFLMVS